MLINITLKRSTEGDHEIGEEKRWGRSRRRLEGRKQQESEQEKGPKAASSG
jgi:hypothetical protein